MEQYKKIARDVRNHFKWYAQNEGIELDETKIVSDFLRYWFNDGKAFIASNQADQIWYPKHPGVGEVDWKWYYDDYCQNPEDYYDSIKFKEGTEYGFEKIPAKKQLTEQQKLTLDYYSVINQIMQQCDDSVRYIVHHYKELSEFGFIDNDANSLFGMQLWRNQNKQPLDLYARILRFSIFEQVYNLKSFAIKELKAMGLNEKGEPLKPRKSRKPKHYKS